MLLLGSSRIYFLIIYALMAFITSFGFTLFDLLQIYLRIFHNNIQFYRNFCFGMLFYVENCSYSEFFVLFCFACLNRFISLSYCGIYQYIDGLWILKFFLHLKFWDVNFRPFVSFKTFVEYRKFYGGFSTLYFLSDMENKTNPLSCFLCKLLEAEV